MKNLILSLIVLFSVSLFAQNYDAKNGNVFVDFGTVAEAVEETAYINLDKLGYARIDSISVTAYGTGELDVDSVDFYVGVIDVLNGINRYSSTAITQTVTINVAAGASAFEQLYDTSGATPLTGEVLRGVNAIKIVVRGADGTDPSDPNRLLFLFKVWGEK